MHGSNRYLVVHPGALAIVKELGHENESDIRLLIHVKDDNLLDLLRPLEEQGFSMKLVEEIEFFK
jgi:hypothetical protein